MAAWESVIKIAILGLSERIVPEPFRQPKKRPKGSLFSFSIEYTSLNHHLSPDGAVIRCCVQVICVASGMTRPRFPARKLVEPSQFVLSHHEKLHEHCSNFGLSIQLNPITGGFGKCQFSLRQFPDRAQNNEHIKANLRTNTTIFCGFSHANPLPGFSPNHVQRISAIPIGDASTFDSPFIGAARSTW